MPYRGCPDVIRRAVDAVLAQTHTDLTLIVVNDGDHDTPPWPALADITDPRLIRLHLPENRGRYHADAVTLAACRTPWWTVHDADDAADPRWLQVMLGAAARRRVDVVLTAQIVHGIRGATVVSPVRPWTGPDPQQITHHAHMAGLWSVPWLRSVCGPHPEYQVGWDTVMTSMPFLVGRVRVVDTPLYHRHRRVGSLTASRDTGMRSAIRRAATSRSQRLWPRLVAAADHGPTAVGEVIAGDVSPETWDTVAADQDRLSRLLCSASDPCHTQAAPARYAATECADDTLWTGWALDRGTAAELDARLADLRPKVVVEAGSGSSTVILARYAAATGAQVVTLEHDPRYAARTTALLDRLVPGHTVDLRVAPLADVAGPCGGPWYDTALPSDIDFALVDGPPEASGGRAAALPALWSHLAPGWEVWLDDGTRPGERAAVAAWKARYGVTVEDLPGAKRPRRITAEPVARAAVCADDVAVTILTGARPHLLARSLDALRATAPGLLDTARVTVLLNGADRATRDVLGRHTDVIDTVDATPMPIMSIGAATSRLAAAARASGRRWWLHLEDDWVAGTVHDGWLDDARGVLLDHPDVGHVRLRHRGDTTLGWHMVTRAPLVWTPGRLALHSPAAHWTLNPTLVRVADIDRVWPANSEAGAQRRAHAAGLRGAAQMLPGVFVHAGGGVESLRARTSSQ
jgi:predicted O-methyltransferase YrrM